MRLITVKFTDGREEDWGFIKGAHGPKPRLTFEGAFVIIHHDDGSTAFPAHIVASVHESVDGNL